MTTLRIIGCMIVIVSASGLMYAGLSGHGNENAFFTPNNPPWVVAHASIISGPDGTSPNNGWAVQTQTHGTMASVRAYAADGTVLTDNAAVHGLSSGDEYWWEANVRYTLVGHVKVYNHVDPVDDTDTSTYESQLLLDVGFVDVGGTWSAWNISDSDDPKIVNEDKGPVEGTAQAAVVHNLENINAIHVAFLHELDGTAQSDRAELIVGGEGSPGDPPQLGGYVKLWHQPMGSPLPPAVLKENHPLG